MNKFIKDRSEKYYFLKYKYVLNKVIDYFKDENYFRPVNTNILDEINKIEYDYFIDKSSDFLILSIHRLYSSISNKDDDFIKVNINYFLINCFDCYFDKFTNDNYIEIFNGGDTCLLLVSHNISLPSTHNRICRLTKLSNNKIEFKIIKINYEQIITKYEIDLNDIPNHHKLFCTTYPNHSNLTLIYQRHQSIFEEEYYNQCNGTATWGYLLKDKLDIAFNTIKDIDSTFYSEILNTIKFVVPLGNSDDLHLVSFSSAMLKKTIFLSIYMEGAFLIESIIHEYSHCQLHYVQDTILLTKTNERPQIFYSPWRPDARPLTALIHALFVFHSIVIFFDKYFDSNKSLTQDVKDRMILILFQLKIGVKQVDFEMLTDYTIDLVNSIKIVVDNLFAKYNCDLSNPPTAIKEHQQQWLLDNKQKRIID